MLQGIRELAKAFLADEKNAKVRPLKLNSTITVFSDEAMVQHIMWMLTELLTMEDVEKATRWLGFIQGVLWTTRQASVDQLRYMTEWTNDDYS